MTNLVNESPNCISSTDESVFIRVQSDGTIFSQALFVLSTVGIFTCPQIGSIVIDF